jgi:Cu(I)/Ag(I) efflux system membrane fusion protein
MCCFVFSCKESTPKTEDTISQQKVKDVYYCPMHPEIQQDHPGKCPKPECMGMELVKKVSEDIMNTILKPVNSSVLASTQTIKPIDTTMPMIITTQGYVDYDNCVKRNIASTVSGRIEKLYIKTNFQPIKQGERVMEVYSPELVTAQENLIYLLKNELEDNSLVLSAKEKLHVLGMSETQIKSVCANKKLQKTVAVYSKWNGVVREENKTANSSTEMNEATSPSTTRFASNSFSLKEGMYVNEGQTIFNVVDPQKPVVMMQVKAKDIAAIHTKQQVMMIWNDNASKEFQGIVDFIEPLQNNAKTTLVRVIFKEKNIALKTGMLVEGKIETDGVEGVFVPTTSVMDAGRNKYVWVKKNGHFIAKKIEVGAITKDWIEIYDGITKKDEIAVQAHYLLDSEGFLKTEEDATE